MESLLSLENLFTLLMLILLQAVLGFDNLLYISIESGRVEAERQKFVRWLGISLAIILRLVLMVVVLGLINSLTQPLFGAQLDGIFEASFTFHSIVSIFGGGFIMWTATKEIMQWRPPFLQSQMRPLDSRTRLRGGYNYCRHYPPRMRT